MATSTAPRIAIVGTGRLGASLAAALAHAGYPVQTTHAANAAVDAADLIFLTVPDAAIAQVATKIDWRSGQFAVHCSGAMGLGALSSATAAGAITGTFHPLQSFPSRDPNPGLFERITVGVEAAEPLGSLLETIAARLGARAIRLEGVDRALYHAAAVFANNYVVALMSAATRTWQAAGLPAEAARAALAPLLLAGANNTASAAELRDALTGPVARGDTGTVARHIAALEPSPELRELYRRLALELLNVVPERAAALRAALNEPRE